MKMTAEIGAKFCDFFVTQAGNAESVLSGFSSVAATSWSDIVCGFQMPPYRAETTSHPAAPWLGHRLEIANEGLTHLTTKSQSPSLSRDPSGSAAEPWRLGLGLIQTDRFGKPIVRSHRHVPTGSDVVSAR